MTQLIHTTGVILPDEEQARKHYTGVTATLNNGAGTTLNPTDPNLLTILLNSGYSVFYPPTVLMGKMEGNIIPFEDGYTKEVLDVPNYQENILASNIQMIWKAANDYVEAQISGAAYGMVSTLITLNKITPGVGLKGKAVKQWIDSVWAQYYINKYMLQQGSPFNQNMLDYSSHGEMPYTVPELKAELDSVGV